MMRRTKARQICREYRAIPFEDLPTVRDDDTGELRQATQDELKAFGIYVFDQGAHKAQALYNGYWCDVQKCGVDARGNPWPGEFIDGQVGLYGEKREDRIRRSLESYKGGNNGGRVRLLQTPRGEETRTEDPETLTERERLHRRLPKIAGDYIERD